MPSKKGFKRDNPQNNIALRTLASRINIIKQTVDLVEEIIRLKIFNSSSNLNFNQVDKISTLISRGIMIQAPTFLLIQ